MHIDPERVMFRIRHLWIRLTIKAEYILDRAAARTSRMKICVAVLSCLCLVAAAPLMADRPGAEHFFVYGLSVHQKDFALTANWRDAGCDEYTVIVSSGIMRSVQKTKDTSAVFKGVKPGREYKVTVLGKKDGKGLSEPATVKRQAVKERQDLKVAKTEGDGFKGDSLSVKTKAPGDVTYESTDESIASVDEDGNVTLKKTGHSQIIITAAGTDKYKQTVQRKNIDVYPKTMDTPQQFEVADSDGSSAVLTWERVDFAKGYRIYQKNSATGEYEPYTETDAAETQVEITRDAGDYKVMAIADVDGKTVESDLSDGALLTPASDDAKSYSSLTRLGTIDSDGVEKVVTLQQNGLTLQSMCVTEEGYIVVFSARSGNAGKLVKYSFEGELLDEAETGSIGHGNGCAYDPNTGTVYVALSYSKKKVPELAAFDAKSLERKDNIKLGSCPSAIAYDRYSDEFYMKDGGKIIVTDGDMTAKKRVPRFSRNIAQDIGAYNGLILSAVWNGGYSGSVDLYRSEDGAYLGTYAVNLGEIESIAVQDGKFVILVNNGVNDAIYITKDTIDFS